MIVLIRINGFNLAIVVNHPISTVNIQLLLPLSRLPLSWSRTLRRRVQYIFQVRNNLVSVHIVYITAYY